VTTTACKRMISLHCVADTGVALLCCSWEQHGESEFTTRVTLNAARHILATLQPLRGKFQRKEISRCPKAVVFSQFQNDLDLVASVRTTECRQTSSPAGLRCQHRRRCVCRA